MFWNKFLPFRQVFGVPGTFLPFQDIFKIFRRPFVTFSGQFQTFLE